VVLLDSSVLIAYHNERDIHHPAAALVMNDFTAGVWGTGVLLEDVKIQGLAPNSFLDSAMF
jgi:predicted nucleic acid-binding protein